MKNIHVLPTDKPSRLFEDDLQLYYSKDKNRIGSIVSNHHIYITSDEEIKEGDWVLFISTNEVIKVPLGGFKGKVCKKIILTTDQDLIKDGVQAIDDEFLEWFVKNPSCEEVEVEEKEVFVGFIDANRKKPIYDDEYKIIIPKEEAKQETQGYICPRTKKQCDDECCVSAKDCHLEASMGVLSEPKQETLEEAAEKFAKKFGSEIDSTRYYAFINGAKWQQERMYSEEEVPTNLESVLAKITHQNDLGLSQWHEVVYYDNDDDKWCCYSGSKTFQDGERVVAWKYCKDLI